MMFDNVEVGDEVSVYNTDNNRSYHDMIRYIGRQCVTAVTPGTLTIAQGTFLRRNGLARSGFGSRWSVRPADDARDAVSLQKQTEYAAQQKAKAKAKAEAKP